MAPPTCPDCLALLAEMESAITEANATIQEGESLIYTGKPPEHIEEWRQIMELWENAHRRWVIAAKNFRNHIATKHQGTPPGREHGQS